MLPCDPPRHRRRIESRHARRLSQRPYFPLVRPTQPAPVQPMATSSGQGRLSLPRKPARGASAFAASRAVNTAPARWPTSRIFAPRSNHVTRFPVVLTATSDTARGSGSASPGRRHAKASAPAAPSGNPYHDAARFDPGDASWRAIVPSPAGWDRCRPGPCEAERQVQPSRGRVRRHRPRP